MVPCHPFNEMKPNSGAGAWNLGSRWEKVFQLRLAGVIASISSRIANAVFTQSPFCRSFVIGEMCKPRPDIARFIEMSGDTLRAPPHGKCETAEIGHDGEDRFIGNVVADENRKAPAKRHMGHEFANACGFGKAGMLDFANEF